MKERINCWKKVKSNRWMNGYFSSPSAKEVIWWLIKLVGILFKSEWANSTQQICQKEGQSEM